METLRKTIAAGSSAAVFWLMAECWTQNIWAILSISLASLIWSYWLIRAFIDVYREKLLRPVAMQAQLSVQKIFKHVTDYFAENSIEFGATWRPATIDQREKRLVYDIRWTEEDTDLFSQYPLLRQQKRYLKVEIFIDRIETASGHSIHWQWSPWVEGSWTDADYVISRVNDDLRNMLGEPIIGKRGQVDYSYLKPPFPLVIVAGLLIGNALYQEYGSGEIWRIYTEPQPHWKQSQGGDVLKYNAHC